MHCTKCDKKNGKELINSAGIILRNHPQLQNECTVVTQKHVDGGELLKLQNRLKSVYKSCQRSGYSPLAVASPQVHACGSCLSAFLFNNKLYINPTYSPSGTVYIVREQCLSDHGVEHIVRRYRSILVYYSQIIDGELVYNNKYERLAGLDAQVFQHEVDHLRGRCIWNTMI